MSDRALTVQEVAERYAVTDRAVTAWIKSGELRAMSVNRRPGARKPRWRVTAESLRAFELIRSHDPTPPKTRRRKQAANVIEFY